MGFRIVDIECFSNYFLLLAMDSETGQVYRWERFNDADIGRDKAELRAMLDEHTTVTFNGLGYDWWLLSLYVARHTTNEQLHDLSNYLINTKMAQYRVRDDRGIEPYRASHFDLMPVAPLVASLKIYGGRIHAPKLQDLPVHYSATIDKPTRDSLYRYCINDLHLTERLRRSLLPQLKLRARMSRDYRIRLISKSDPQIAETVIKHRLLDKKVKAYRPKEVPGEYRFDPPACIRMQSDTMKKALETVCSARFPLSKAKVLLCPKAVKEVFTFRQAGYKMGIGGLHSQEKSQSITIGPGEYLTDLDVTSYYPYLILTNRLFPEHIGPAFLDVYKSIVDERVAAKQTGDTVTAEALKIVINSSFGKFGSQYSSLFSPKLLLQTTMSGQLYLLMLIEMIQMHTACRVTSANTDGITVHSPNETQHRRMLSVAKKWERRTRLQLEPNEYRATHSVDVNNYMAVKLDGGVKGKGIFASDSLKKNPNTSIVATAVAELLTTGVALDETITGCTDVRQFSILRKVTGGALYRDDAIGSTVRWYQGTNGSPVLYLSNLNRVPNASKAQVINQLPSSLPKDVDYAEYIFRADELVSAVGATETTHVVN